MSKALLTLGTAASILLYYAVFSLILFSGVPPATAGKPLSMAVAIDITADRESDAPASVAVMELSPDGRAIFTVEEGLVVYGAPYRTAGSDAARAAAAPDVVRPTSSGGRLHLPAARDLLVVPAGRLLDALGRTWGGQY